MWIQLLTKTLLCLICSPATTGMLPVLNINFEADITKFNGEYSPYNYYWSVHMNPVPLYEH